MNDISKRLPVSELEKLVEYQRLTPKQRLFIATYCAGGLVDGHYDPVAACMTAYQCKSQEVARIMSYALMANIRIIEVLNRHFNTEPIDSFMVTLDRAIANKKLTIANLNALRLKSEILGFTTRIDPSHPARNAAFQEAQEKDREIRKTKRKKPVREPKPEEPSEYDNY